MTTTLEPTATTTAVPREIGLRFAAEMPGLDGYRHYTLSGIDDGPIYWLRCDQAPEIVLPVANAFAVAPGYTFELPDADAAALHLRHAADALVLTVLTVASSGEITANLLAPLVVNCNTWTAKQVILDGSRHHLRHRLA